MSLYSALYAGVSGLSAQANAMASVADNITNINTVGYKNADTQFRTLVADGRVGSSYSAAGVAAVTQSLVSKQGVLQASSSTTDVGISGAGFFVTKDGIGTNASIAYTRAGSFAPDDEGYLKNSGGYFLQGWPLDVSGQPTSSDPAGLVPIRVSQLSGTAAATGTLNMGANLDATATANTTYVVGSGTLANDTTLAQFKKSFDVSDAQGGKHSVTLAFVKIPGATGANTWASEIYASPPGDISTGGTASTTGLLASGTITFNADGSFNSSTLPSQLFDPASTPAVSWTNKAGSVPITLSLGTVGGTDGLTQYASTSGMKSYSVDGGPLGSVASTNISKDGVVSAVFADGTSRAVFQLPLASFQNPNGLTRLPGNAYAVSSQSGGVAINAPGTLGSGAISSSTLEASTVDLAQEFTNMIRFQRAYSASSKIITTVDEMLQEVSNLKR